MVGGITHRFVFRANPGAASDVVRCLEELRTLARQHGVTTPTRIYPARRFPLQSHEVAWEWDGPEPFETLKQTLTHADGAGQTYQRHLKHLETVIESVLLELWERDE